MRADIHDGPERKTLQSKAGYIDARPLTASSTKSSCDARPDHTLGHKQTSLLRPLYGSFTLKAGHATGSWMSPIGPCVDGSGLSRAFARRSAGRSSHVFGL